MTDPAPESGLPDFRRLDYLAQGSAGQRHAHALLLRHDLFGRLAPLDAALAGTFPLDLQVPGSDLDILVAAADPAALAPHLSHLFGHWPDYRHHVADFAQGPALVASFSLDGMPLEIFAQALPVERQMGWRHMLVEARLLRLFPAARPALLAMKRRGIKTEPAFARLFGLDGDPYQALLLLENRPEDDVKQLKINRSLENI